MVLVQDTDMPNTNFSVHEKGVYCARIKSFSNLSSTIKSLKHDIWVLKPAIVTVLSPILHNSLPWLKIFSYKNKCVRMVMFWRFIFALTL
jgi:hypothetical protein